MQSTVDSVLARFRRRQKSLTRLQFLQEFYAKTDASAFAYSMSAWAERPVSPAFHSLVERLISQDDPLLVELRRQDAEILAQLAVGRKRA